MSRESQRAARRDVAPPFVKDRLALCVQQPWAELILRGEKAIEVRTSTTNQRGAIYLYASRKFSTAEFATTAIERFGIDAASLPVGCIVGTIDLFECRPATIDDAAAACVPGDWLPGRFAWMVRNPQRLSQPAAPRFIPYGIWFYPFQRRQQVEST